MLFKDPFILGLIPFVFLIPFFIFSQKKSAGFRFPTLNLLTQIPVTWKIRFHFIPNILRILTLIFFLAALAGPRKILQETVHRSEGIDIVLAIDCSMSMAAMDFTIGQERYNRLTVIKNVVRDVIQRQVNNRIGLIAFAGRAYSVCPLTTDYDWLLTNFERLELGQLEDGTAIGSAINSSLNRFKNSRAKSKVIILLTDGVNNAGRIDPLTAAKIAQTMKVKIYTIGAGAKGYAPFPVKDFFGRTVYQNIPVDLDEETLKEIARLTNAQYFRATDTEALEEIYRRIDALEKTKIESNVYVQYRERFAPYVMTAMIVILLEVALAQTLLRTLP